MNLEERRRFLSRIEVFSKCKRGDLKALARSCDEMTFEMGEDVCRQGEKGAAMFLITEGKAEVLEQKKDETMFLAELGEGAVIGELSVIDGEERTATVRAKERMTCLVLTSWDLKATIKDRPEIALDILKMVISRYRTLTDKLKQL
jgi:CRP/FNR family cyclic AMP-dependent transcriptional regulator